MSQAIVLLSVTLLVMLRTQMLPSTPVSLPLTMMSTLLRPQLVSQTLLLLHPLCMMAGGDLPPFLLLFELLTTR